MANYDLLTDYGIAAGTDPGEISVSAYWIVAVVRFKYPITFSRQAGASFSDVFARAVEVRGRPLIITDDCLSVSVSTTKGSPSSKMNCTLAPGRYDYLSEVFPDDWVFAWMFNNLSDAERILGRLQGANIEPCNDWKSGLKFVGRVESMSKDLTQTPDGIRFVRYSMSASGFDELQAKVLYNPYLLRQFNGIGKYMQSLNIAFNDFISKGAQGVETETAVRTFIDLLLGKGVKRNQGLPTGTVSSGASAPPSNTAGAEGEYAYIVPTMVGDILGKKHGDEGKKLLSASDFIDTIVGVQTYGNGLNKERPWEAFLPSNLMDAKTQRKQTKEKMKGSFLPVEPQLNNKTVWSVLNSYLNPILNEMYATLRADHDGNIVPTVVARQLPFSGQKGAEKKSVLGELVGGINANLGASLNSVTAVNLTTTTMLELPRWYIHPILITNIRLGRSKALKFNYVQVMGDPGQMKSTHAAPPLQISRNPPVRDDLDVARSGLRDFQQVASVSLASINEGQMKEWTKIIADIVHGQHMALTGTCSLFGVQAPICIGDNVEVDGTVLHIESVNHQCSITGEGQKTFRTTLGLSHGMSAEPLGTDLGLYSGVQATQNRSFEPGITNEDPGIVPPAPEGMSFGEKELDPERYADIEKAAEQPKPKPAKRKPKRAPKLTQKESDAKKIAFRLTSERLAQGKAASNIPQHLNPYQ